MRIMRRKGKGCHVDKSCVVEEVGIPAEKET
jgi:hypothetical protein